MLRRCLLAVIVALLVTMTGSQIVSAEDIDWNRAPRISNKAQLYQYIENERLKGNPTIRKIHVILTYFKFSTDEENFKKDRNNLAEEFYNDGIVNALHSNVDGVPGTGRLIFTIKEEYPGTRVANAYISRDKYQAWLNLTDEEKKLYNISVGIIDEANKRSSEVEKARYIHNAICDRVWDYKNETDRNKTAIGALIDHYAQCVGYSDAFYMLGRMCGLKVCRIGGYVNVKTNIHEWNTITFADGKTYFVDVTLDDRYNSYDWFLRNRKNMEKTHQCNWNMIPNLQ